MLGSEYERVLNRVIGSNHPRGVRGEGGFYRTGCQQLWKDFACQVSKEDLLFSSNSYSPQADMFTSYVRLGARSYWGWKDCGVRQRILISRFLFKIGRGRDRHRMKMQESCRVNCKESNSLTKALCHLPPAPLHPPGPALVLEKVNINVSWESKFLPDFWPNVSPKDILQPWSVLTTLLFQWLLHFHLLRNLVLWKRINYQKLCCLKLYQKEWICPSCLRVTLTQKQLQYTTQIQGFS